MRSMFGNKCMCESTYIFYDEPIQIYNKNKLNVRRNETVHDSLRLATPNTGIAQGTIVSET